MSEMKTASSQESVCDRQSAMPFGTKTPADLSTSRVRALFCANVLAVMSGPHTDMCRTSSNKLRKDVIPAKSNMWGTTASMAINGRQHNASCNDVTNLIFFERGLLSWVGTLEDNKSALSNPTGSPRQHTSAADLE